MVLIRTQAGKTKEALSSLEKVYKDINPNYPLEVQFVDTKYKQLLFSRDFLGLIAIAFLIAAPLGGYFMHSWLRDFSYRISLSWWIFALAGGGCGWDRDANDQLAGYAWSECESGEEPSE